MELACFPTLEASGGTLAQGPPETPCTLRLGPKVDHPFPLPPPTHELVGEQALDLS